MELEYYFGGGAYNDYGVNIARAAGYSCTGPYNVPNVKGDSYCVYTNQPVGAPCAALACPRSTGASSRSWTSWPKIGMDPAAFRLRNCVRTGDDNPDRHGDAPGRPGGLHRQGH